MATHPSVDELEKREEEAFKTGPLSVLTTSVKSNSQVNAPSQNSSVSHYFRPCTVVTYVLFPRYSSIAETTASY